MYTHTNSIQKIKHNKLIKKCNMTPIRITSNMIEAVQLEGISSRNIIIGMLLLKIYVDE